MKPSDLQLDEASVLLITAEGIIIEVCETACPAIGWSREDLLNKSLGGVFEYGADLILEQLHQLQSGAIPEGMFSVSALVRRKDLSHFPTTATVRPMPELDCFVVAFDALAKDVAEASELLATEAESAPVLEPVIELTPAARAVAQEEPVALPADVHNGNGHANGDGPRFRNIFLSGAQRPGAENNGSKPENDKHDFAAQLETERQERRRLEARVLSLNDQLQQLHVQLKSSLESENIYQKRVSECEEAVRNAEEKKDSTATALREEKEHRESLEQEFDDFKAACARTEEARDAWQQEWLSKLESSLAALHESDARMEKEIATRRGIDVTLQMLGQDFSAQLKDRKFDLPTPAPKSRVEAELVAA
jgi:hypothetical protein